VIFNVTEIYRERASRESSQRLNAAERLRGGLGSWQEFQLTCRGGQLGVICSGLEIPPGEQSCEGLCPTPQDPCLSCDS
jgi:hypothetical protein